MECADIHPRRFTTEPAGSTAVPLDHAAGDADTGPVGDGRDVVRCAVREDDFGGWPGGAGRPSDGGLLGDCRTKPQSYASSRAHARLARNARSTRYAKTKTRARAQATRRTRARAHSAQNARTREAAFEDEVAITNMP